MPQIDLHAEIARIRQLGSDFADLHNDIHSLPLTPGTETRRQLTEKILAVNGLVEQLTERLDTLDGSQYAAIPGSRPSLELLASMVHTAAIASSELATVLLENPLEAAAFPGPPADEAAVRAARHKKAAPKMAEHLTSAAHRLELAHTGCYYLATGITRDVIQHVEHSRATTAPKVTDRQAEVLARLSSGDGTLTDSGRMGVAKAVDHDRAAIHLATLNSLIKRRLVSVDTTTSRFTGQRLTVTSEGRHALARHQQSNQSARTPSALPQAVQQPTARRR
ncbi:hypothetical protein [Streptomyces hokutonensis]|uniref:hypothetical protein n=1 Tax=Streptomyces hokutonensis TaxID=1306990 RepID=UPI00380BA7A8